MVIYLDLLMLLNAAVDFLLLLGADRLLGYPSRMGACLAAAILGGVYSGACLLPGFAFLGSFLWRTVCLVLMGGLAYGWNRRGIIRCGVFLLLVMALGGMAASANQGGIMALLWAAGLWLMCVFMTGRVGGSRYLPLRICHGGRSLDLLALRDTGNTLRDPVTGESVVVIGPEAAGILTGLTQAQLKDPVGTMAESPLTGLRLIPCSTVGGRGMLLGLRFPDVTLGNCRRSALVAFASQTLGGDIQALTGGMG